MCVCVCVCVWKVFFFFFFFGDRQKERASNWLNTCQISAVDLQYIFLFMISCTLAITKTGHNSHVFYMYIFQNF